MIPNMRILTVTCLGETERENARVTLSAMNVKMTAAVDGEMQGRPVKITAVFFVGEDMPTELVLSEFDLLQIESCIGAYGFFEE
jgi:hypothetical protein